MTATIHADHVAQCKSLYARLQCLFGRITGAWGPATQSGNRPCQAFRKFASAVTQDLPTAAMNQTEPKEKLQDRERICYVLLRLRSNESQLQISSEVVAVVAKSKKCRPQHRAYLFRAMAKPRISDSGLILQDRSRQSLKKVQGLPMSPTRLLLSARDAQV